jgi:hypothetical protein
MAKGREDRIIEAATGGALGGAAAGYLGSGPLNVGGLVDKLLLGAGLGSGAALIVLVVLLIVLRISWREVLQTAWWLIPSCAGLCALVMGYKELLGWAFGWALAGWATGWRAALLGGVVGAMVFGGIAFIATRPNKKTPRTTAERAASQESH